MKAAQQINWFFLTFGVLGGLAVFLYGMFLLNEGLQKIAGSKMKQLLMKIAGGRINGLLTGLAVTSVVQSSSATTVLTVGLVGAGLMTFTQSLPIIMGAEIGTTITAQIVAFKITDYALMLCSLGYFVSLFVRNKKIKYIAEAIFGFGMLFFGIKVMSDTLKPMRTYQPFLELMRNVEHPLIGILIGLGFTLIIQSSSATSGIVVAMAIAGTLTLAQAIPINLGASIGTCITAFLGSLQLNRDAKRSAYFHIVSQTIGVLIVIPFLMLIKYEGIPSWTYFVIWFTKTFFGTEDVPRQIAMAHTLMPVVKTIIILPVLPLIASTMIKMFPSKEEEKPFGPKHITEELLDAPSLALEKAKNEILHQAKIVQEMLEKLPSAFHKDTRCQELCEQISLTDIKVDILRKAIVDYLSKLGQRNLSEEDSKREVALLFITTDIEAIGDIIDKNIMPLAKKMFDHSLVFSPEGWKDLTAIYQRLMTNYNNMLKALESEDPAITKIIADEKIPFARFESELRLKHIERLHSAIAETHETSAIHIDLLEQYKRINSYIASISYAIRGEI